MGHARGHVVDALERVVDAGLVGEGQRVEDGVRGAAHRHVEREGVVERLRRDDGARSGPASTSFMIWRAALPVELLAVFAVGQDGAVAGQREAEGFAQAVHGVGGEHAGAGAAAGTAGVLEVPQLLPR